MTLDWAGREREEKECSWTETDPGQLVLARRGGPSTKRATSLCERGKDFSETCPGDLAPQGTHPWTPLPPEPSGRPTVLDRPYTVCRRMLPHAHPDLRAQPGLGSHWPSPPWVFVWSPQWDPEGGCDMWYINTPRELICPGWISEVGPAGTITSPTHPLVYPSPFKHTCFCPLFSSLAKSPRLLWSLTSCFN